MKVRDLLIRIGADPDDLKRGLGNAKKEVQRFGKDVSSHMDRAANSIRNLGAVLASAFAVNGIKEVGLNMIKLAMDAQESENKFQVVLGNMADSARKWSMELSKSLKMNQYEVRNNLAGMYSIIESLGFGGDAALNMSKGLTQLTYDLSSLHNIDTKTAFEKLRSGMVGETEPMMALGVNLLETNLKLKAVQMGLIKTGQEMTEQQKVIARYNIIMEATKKAHGDMARTIDSPANQARIARAKYAELSAQLADKLLPSINKILHGINYLLEKFQKLPDSVQTNIVWFGVAAVALVGLTAALGAVLAVLPFAVQGFGMLATAGKAVGVVVGRFGVVLRGVLMVASRFFPLIALGSALVYIGSQSEWARKKVQSLWDTIKSFLGVQTASAAGADSQTDAVGGLTESYDDYMKAIGGVGDSLQDAKKDADKFLASFDEVYSIPDKAGGDASSAIPPIPAPPTPPSGGSGGGSTGGGTDWIQSLLDKIKLIPSVIKMPTITPPSPPDGGAGAVATAWLTSQNLITGAVNAIKVKLDELKKKLDELKPSSEGASVAWATMLSDMQTNLNAYSPYLIFGLGLLALSMGRVEMAAPITALAFSSMLNQMQVDLNAYQPYISWGLSLIGLSIVGLHPQMNDTKVNFQEMLNSMQTNLNGYQPYISWGLVLLGLSMLALHPQMSLTDSNFKTMLDNMQKNVNAYQPYTSFGLALIGLSIVAMANDATNSEVTWTAAWVKIAEIVGVKTRSINADIKSTEDTYRSLMSALGQPVPVPQTAPVYGPAYPGPYVPETAPVQGPPVPAPLAARSVPVIGDLLKALDALSKNPLSTWAGQHPEVLTPGVGSAGSAIGAGGAAAATKGKAAMQALKEYFESLGMGGAVTGFAGGGIIGNDSIVRVGERGRREAIIPLESNAMQPFASAIADSMGSGGSGDSGGGNGREVYIGVVDKRHLKALERALKIVRLEDDSRGGNR
ncbi:hypothetical protein [Paenibacillus sp. EPM92]|uniref:hypothetical protein n=1 Tax=Paenibacillus sp. EPM92 TaxID=1561195 RepID=UPI001914FBB5|nr:hypothetical protein [Paenibacillus sp. EPM92]